MTETNIVREVWYNMETRLYHVVEIDRTEPMRERWSVGGSMLLKTAYDHLSTVTEFGEWSKYSPRLLAR